MKIVKTKGFPIKMKIVKLEDAYQKCESCDKRLKLKNEVYTYSEPELEGFHYFCSYFCFRIRNLRSVTDPYKEMWNRNCNHWD